MSSGPGWNRCCRIGRLELGGERRCTVSTLLLGVAIRSSFSFIGKGSISLPERLGGSCPVTRFAHDRRADGDQPVNARECGLNRTPAGGMGRDCRDFS